MFVLVLYCPSMFKLLVTLVSCFSFTGREAVYEGCQGGGVAVYEGCQGGGVPPLQDQGSRQTGAKQVKQQETWHCWVVVDCECRWMSLGQILFFAKPRELMVCQSDLHEIRTCVCNVECS